MQREIGSNFWITPDDLNTEEKTCTPTVFNCSGNDFVWLSTGRSAISFALKEARRRNSGLGETVLLPPFTCHTVVQPFLDAGYTVYPYPVDEALEIGGSALLEAAERVHAAVVLVHRYFGFDTLPGCGAVMEALRKKGVVTIEDRTQCLYSDFAPLPVDYVVASIRKWSGVPDGGFVVCREGVFSAKPAEPDRELEAAKIAAALAKYRYLFENIGEKPAFLEQFQNAEAILDRQTEYRMIAGLSLRMQASLNVGILRKRRQENYRTLLRGLEDCPGVHPLFPELPENVIPLYFPICVMRTRSAAQEWLREASIYAPVVWPRPEAMPPVCREAEDFYTQLLCLPIDQRYDTDDMERTAARLRSFRAADETIMK